VRFSIGEICHQFKKDSERSGNQEIIIKFQEFADKYPASQKMLMKLLCSIRWEGWCMSPEGSLPGT